MKRVLVTGGSGFIGRNLVQMLSVDYEIYAPTSRELDLLDAEAVERYLHTHRFDVVVHAATWNATRNSPKDISRVLDCNLRMFFNIARLSSDFGKLISLGSGAEYDRAHWIPRMQEKYAGAFIPTDSYGFSKHIISNYIELTNAEIYNLRLFGVFGQHEDWEIRFISHACCKAVWDLPITIRQNVLFDYMCVGDVVNVVRWFIEQRPHHRVYNVCSGQTHSLLDMAQQVLDVSGKQLEIRVGKDGMGTEYSGDNSRLISELGPLHLPSMKSQISALYEWYRGRRDAIPKDRLLSGK